MRIESNHYVLAVPDLERSRRWYESVLGCETEVVDAGNWLFFYRDGVSFQCGRCPDALDVEALGDHQYFAYLVVDDVGAFFERARGEVGDAGGEIQNDDRATDFGVMKGALRRVCVVSGA